MAAREIIGLFMAVIVLAGLSRAIVSGDKTAQVLGAGANGFASVVKAATLS